MFNVSLPQNQIPFSFWSLSTDTGSLDARSGRRRHCSSFSHLGNNCISKLRFVVCFVKTWPCSFVTSPAVTVAAPAHRYTLPEKQRLRTKL